jgi:hypothetical protein
MPRGGSASAYAVRKEVELIATEAEIEAPRGIKPVVSYDLNPSS